MRFITVGDKAPEKWCFVFSSERKAIKNVGSYIIARIALPHGVTKAIILIPENG